MIWDRISATNANGLVALFVPITVFRVRGGTCFTASMRHGACMMTDTVVIDQPCVPDKMNDDMPVWAEVLHSLFGMAILQDKMAAHQELTHATFAPADYVEKVNERVTRFRTWKREHERKAGGRHIDLMSPDSESSPDRDYASDGDSKSSPDLLGTAPPVYAAPFVPREDWTGPKGWKPPPVGGTSSESESDVGGGAGAATPPRAPDMSEYGLKAGSHRVRTVSFKRAAPRREPSLSLKF
jgi:hypothetical protein